MQHDPSDGDSSVFAQHHTLGTKATQAAAGNHQHNDITGGFLDIVGPFSSAAPPNGTTGAAIVITKSGTYLFTGQASGYAGAANVNTAWSYYIDGSLVATRNQFFNPASTHMPSVIKPWTTFLTAGTHYWWLQFSVGGSDANDYGALTWTRVGP